MDALFLSDWLTATRAVSPDHLAVIYHETDGQIRRLTYRQLYDQAINMAYRLERMGVQQGDHVAVCLPNSMEYVVLIHALVQLRAVLVPINTRLTPDEAQERVTQADCRWLVDPQRLAEIHLMPLPNDVNPLPYRERAFNLEALCAIVHTSGTSGRSKGVMLAYRQFFYSAMSSAYRIGTSPTDRWLCVMPLYHVGGLSIVFRAVLYGITLELAPKFDAEWVHAVLKREQITLVSLVPTMLYRLIQRMDTPNPFPALRLILLGGAAASPNLLAQARDLYLPIATTYGLTECTSQVATHILSPDETPLGSVGKPLFMTEIRIVNQQGEPALTNEWGEVAVRSPMVMNGYYNHPTATAQAIRDGWLYTGDIGYLDPHSDLWIMQRRSDLIITGGENVYPIEVETVLNQFPSITESIVVGLEDAEWGQLVVAVVVSNDPQSLNLVELQQHTRQHLAGYKVPRRWLVVDALPYNASAKVDRNAVKELFQ
ncbi:MAG: o-succinylbenzoate--CoA ligase [Phototrophicaceae bacterium]